MPDDLIALAERRLSEDKDYLDAPNDNDLAWLAAQLADWPNRVDESCTTNLRFLLMSAAHFILAALRSREAAK